MKSQELKHYEATFRLVRGEVVLRIRRHLTLRNDIKSGYAFFNKIDYKKSFTGVRDAILVYFTYPRKYTDTGLLEYAGLEKYIDKFARCKHS